MVIDYSWTINLFTVTDAYPLPQGDDTVTQLFKCKVFSTVDFERAYHQTPLAHGENYSTAVEIDGKLHQFNRIPFG